LRVHFARHGESEVKAINLAVLIVSAAAAASAQPIVLERDGSTIALEPYAPNVVRVTLSLERGEALTPPGFGFVARPAADGWTHERGDDGDVYRSPRLVVTVAVNRPGKPLPTQVDIARFFNGSAPPADITFATPQGRTLLHMTGWQMSVPNHKDGNASILADRRDTDAPFFQVGATFAAPDDEHYYGLGQHQEGFLDHRGHAVQCWQDYLASGGPSVCVPFMVTNHGYGLVWDNPSKTRIEPGMSERTRFISEVGNRVSYFVIAGATTDEIYGGYRRLTGETPMLPKAAYGYIQCKQRYTSQDEVLEVAKGYRERGLPADVVVVDWFYYTRMGQMDFIPERWPDPAAMNRKLHDMGFETMISVWPRFTEDSRYYDLLLRNGWFTHLADGTPIDGLPYDRAGSDIDTTDPEAARWFWETIRDNILSKGFDSLWADQTEPDLPPNGAYFHVGPGTRFFNIYPLVHTQALYDGFRRDLPDRRALTLARDAYLGSQRNGTITWSSDILPTWDTLKRQIPTGLGFTAAGMAYWTNDIGGWEYLPAVHVPAHPPLLDPSDARANVGGYDDYPELYARWFQYAAFLPIFRAHGSRVANEVWSYGKQAEAVLVKYLKLRYELLPYVYSLAHFTRETGAPYMRALFMDFPSDPKVADLRDEYMFGPAFLVAPVTDQGVTHRSVYLPAGADWWNFWTNERVRGGRTIDVAAPIDTLPLFVRAGSIVPLGSSILSTKEHQDLAKVLVYPGADGEFTLYDDDGRTYAYEKDGGRVTRLRWDDRASRLTYEGPGGWTGSLDALVSVAGR
jgi:alpha-D-xyloside xylohydrolase